MCLGSRELWKEMMRRRLLAVVHAAALSHAARVAALPKYYSLARSSRALPVGMCTASPTDEDMAFARRHLHTTLAAATASAPSTPARVILPLPLATFQTAATLFVVIVLAGSAAAELDCLCWPAADPRCTADAVRGTGFGVLGAIAMQASDAFHSAGAQLPRGEKDLRVATVSASETEPCAANSVLVGTMPLALFARVGAGDGSLGERSVSSILEAESLLAGAFVHITGTLAACAWAHGVVQQACSLGLTNLALQTAMRTMPEDPAATWWWPIVASGTLFAPLLAALVAAAITTVADIVVTRSLRPTATDETEARVEAVTRARQRSADVFALEAAPEVAARRSRAFDDAAGQWLLRAHNADVRMATSSAARALIASAAYAASGSQLAPVVAGVFGASKTVTGVLRGRS